MIQTTYCCVKPTAIVQAKNDMKELVLASGSQYRRSLLQKLQLPFTFYATDVDESRSPHEDPEALAIRLAIAKALALAKHYPNHLIIGSDQVAVCEGNLLGKPGDRINAINQLKTQSGRKASFSTGLCLLDSASGTFKTALDTCHVHFKALNDQQIQRYIDYEQPFDCAGSFKSEGYGITLFEKFEGDDPNTLIGLPLIKLISLLAEFGIEIP